jgi:hypothetical protein
MAMTFELARDIERRYCYVTALRKGAELQRPLFQQIRAVIFGSAHPSGVLSALWLLPS